MIYHHEYIGTEHHGSGEGHGPQMFFIFFKLYTYI